MMLKFHLIAIALVQCALHLPRPPAQVINFIFSVGVATDTNLEIAHLLELFPLYLSTVGF